MEKVTIEAFTVIGISVRTTNENGQSAKDIGGLWNKFMTEGILNKIPNKIDDTVYSIYTAYEGDHTKPYTTILGCKVENVDTIPNGMVAKTFKGGNYTKFVSKGDLTKGVVYETWLKIWNSDLDRTYTADFEDYGNKGDASKLPDLRGDAPAFVYAISNKEVQQPAIALAFQLSDALINKTTFSYHPDQSHVQTILAATNSDTLCQIRAAGWRYSAGRAAGAFFLALLTGSMANTSDGGALGVICSDKTGKVLWQDYRPIDNDPMDANMEHIVATLKYFPNINTPLPKTCVADKKKKEVFRCET